MKARREDILRLATEHGARRIRLFGSVARREATEGSDVDFLVEMEPDRNLLDHIVLMQDLEDLLERRVDVVSERALHHLLREQILHEAVAI